MQATIPDQHGGQGRAHAPVVGVGGGLAHDRGVGLSDRADQGRFGSLRVGEVDSVEVFDGADGGLGRDLAGEVATHAVGDGEHGGAAVVVVLVALPHQSDVGGGVGADAQRGHRRTSTTVRPTPSWSPGAIGVGAVTFTWLRKVPLVEPRSLTTHWRPSWEMRAWRSLT